jgi:hypothetical protein
MPEKSQHEDYNSRQVYSSARPAGYDNEDVFGNEESHEIRYKTLSWPMVSVLMIAEIVSNGTILEDSNGDQHADVVTRHAIASVIPRSRVGARKMWLAFVALSTTC